MHLYATEIKKEIVDRRHNVVTISPVFSEPFQAQWCQMVTLQSVQHHTGLTHPFNFLHAGTLALSPERQSARMSKN